MSELKFKRDTAFRKQFFTPDSFAHPAKMDAQLLIWLVQTYTMPGEVILDPMAGMGTTMLACTLGRDVVLVELEVKFCKMMRDNWELVKMRPQLGYQMGECQIIQGDARQLEGLVDKIVTSPPFGEAQSGGGIAKHGYINQFSHAKNPDTVGNRSYMPETHGESQGQIGNLPYGQMDKIVTSPPFQEPEIRRSGQVESREGYNYGSKLKMSSDHPDNISKLAERDYGNIDSIITSPPYEDSLSEPEDRKHSIDQSKWGDGRKIAPPHSQVHLTYPSGSPNNIGNLKGDTYLSAMLQVYQQCYKVLKPSGLLILVTKNFIRKKQEIRLDEDTIKLCEQAGFTFVERHYRELSAQSFWRVIYKQKYPDAPAIDKEDILVFKK